MPQIDQTASMAIQPELTPGESVLWTGRPSPKVIFHREDLYLVPFSFLWGGFAIFWEASAGGLFGHSRGVPSAFMLLWGIPFVVIGQYLIWGRFLYSAWKKKRTFYAVTNRRVIVVQHDWSRRIESAYVDGLPVLARQNRSDGIGSLRFSQAENMWTKRRGWGAWDPMAMGSGPVFVDIEDADSVYRLISELREKRGFADSKVF